jgi:hypothetical protein
MAMPSEMTPDQADLRVVAAELGWCERLRSGSAAAR